MRIRHVVPLLGAVVGVVASAAPAQMPMTRPMPSSHAATTPWSAANDAAMARMDRAMSDAPAAADEDHAFVEGMMPHHQGAIDMARVELEYGRDPHLKALARAIVAAQERELGTMRAWLARHPDRR